jgi:hypothetical protein
MHKFGGTDLDEIYAYDLKKPKFVRIIMRSSLSWAGAGEGSLEWREI